MTFCSDWSLNPIFYLRGMSLEVAEYSPVKIGTVSPVVTSTVTDNRAIRVNDRLYIEVEAHRLETITIDRVWRRHLVIFTRLNCNNEKCQNK
jgi:hypothetical protein